MEYTKLFKELNKSSAEIAGGKGASLGEMLNAGIPVPDGFVVLSTTFDKFLNKVDLTQEIDAILDSVDHKAIHSIDAASEKIQDLIKHAQMPADITSEIESQFALLGAEFVAVRSSATAEDGADHAWAGQLESYLNTTKDTLLEKVQHCWASLFTPRAIFYRFEKGLHTTKISVAVVVQKMVNSEKSGIAFSVHPVTEDRNQLIIEAGFGLGEAIVSGSVTPDSYVVEKEPRRIIDINVSNQTRAMYRKVGGGNEWLDLGEKGGTQVFTESEIIDLATIILTIENHYGFPCDIEWAYEAGKFYVVQSRPITTLSAVVGPKISFEKAYTRDTTLIIQQGWYDVVAYAMEKATGKKNPHNPPVIHFMNDGVIEIWENEACTKWFLDTLQEEIIKDKSFITNILNVYENDLKEIYAFWDKKVITDKAEFKKYVERIFAVMGGFVFMYYTAGDERTPQIIKERALKMRDTDTYFDTNDRLMRASLVAIYPELKGVETCILGTEIENPPSREILQSRKTNYVMVGEIEGNIGTLRQYQSQHPEFYFSIEIPPADSSTLVGQVGNKGYAKGKVRILKRKEQINEAEEGDIIVSTMTTPDFVPAMQKAIAIVTDEGGITCHAAIVARELNKPCVIGTKFATQILKDGDIVEVDADNGVVRILKSKNDSEFSTDDWKLVITRNMSFWHQYLSSIGHYLNTGDFGVKAKNQQLSITINGTQTSLFARPENMKEYSAAILEAVDSDSKIDALKNKYKTFAEELLASLEVCRKDLNVKTWNDFIKNYTKFCAGLFLTSTIGRAGLDKLIQKLKEKDHKDDEISGIVSTITYPSEHTPLFDSQLILLEIADLIQKKAIDAEKAKNLREEWLKDYGFIPVNFCEEPWSMQDAENQINDLLKKDCASELLNFKKSHEEKIANSEKILKEINDKEISNLSRALAEGTYLNEFRKNIFSQVSLNYRDIFSKIAQMSGSSNWRDCFFLTPPEMTEILGGKKIEIKDLIKERETVGIVVNEKGEIEFLKDNDVKKFKEYLESLHGKKEEKVREKVTSIKGFTANKGNVKGIARVILNSADFNKISGGEILVTTMTSVDFVPIMSKAGAFVTNEGGITSHAAIVAREMNKPCIIGTQFATQIIKDGDMVEVDADNGVVKIIS